MTVVYELTPFINVEATLAGWEGHFPQHAAGLRLVAFSGVDAVSHDHLNRNGIDDETIDGLVKLAAIHPVRIPDDEEDRPHLSIVYGGQDA